MKEWKLYHEFHNRFRRRFVFFLAMTTRAVAESSADAWKTGREREWTRVYNKVESEKDVFTHLEVFWISYPLSARLFRDGNHEPVQGTTRKIELRAWNKKNFVSGLPRSELVQTYGPSSVEESLTLASILVEWREMQQFSVTVSL